MVNLFEPFNYSFFTRGLLVGLLVGAACGTLGCFVVLRGLAFIGDAMAHSILPGMVIAYLMGANILLGAFVAGLLTAGFISLISRTEQVREDTAIGIVFTAAFALGVVLISRQQGYTRDLTHFLFGNVLGIAPLDVWLIGGVAVLIFFGLALWYRPLALAAFDPIHAQTIGFNLGLLHLGLMTLLALTIVTGVQAVGVVLIAALLITPAATAYLLTERLPTMLVLAALLGGSAAVVGLYLSYYIHVASGGTVVLVSTFWFLAALLFAPGRGVLWRSQIKLP
jgi:ABC-type Mn2+/Zn2+ transport system permease subunit